MRNLLLLLYKQDALPNANQNQQKYTLDLTFSATTMTPLLRRDSQMSVPQKNRHIQRAIYNT